MNQNPQNPISQPQARQPQVNVSEAPNYRDTYANSVQVRVSVWDFHLIFGQAANIEPDKIAIQSLQGIYLSPQQAKALCNILGQNLAQYEQAFGEIHLEPQQPQGATGFQPGPIN